MVPSMGRMPATRDYGGLSASERMAERRRRLLEAGRDIWGRSGITDVSVRGVCAEAGLGPRYFYEQFPDRDALLLAVADQLRDELFSVLLQRGLGEPGGVEAKLRAALKALLDMIADDPVVHRIFTDILTGTDVLAERRRQALDTVTNLVLEHGPALLDFEPPTPDEMRRGATFIVGGVTQVVDSWVHDSQESTSAMADACTELCLSVVRRYAAPR
jgi:AcrR family transcriptional regulator